IGQSLRPQGLQVGGDELDPGEQHHGEPSHRAAGWQGLQNLPGLPEAVMNVLDSPLLPNLLYLSLVAGLWLSALAVLSPGTGVYELLAVLALGLAGLGTTVVPPNPWALIPLALGSAFYLVSLRRRQEGIWLGLSALMLSAGSAFLFRREGGGPAGDPWRGLWNTARSGGV